jgi:16S rRNA (cytidine1402-2'-O)-methyltransferase
MPGTLFLVATPIGNLEDITARALRVLGEVSLIAAEDTRRTAHLLTRYAITTPMTSLHEHNETRKAPSLIARLAAGDNVALVSDAGMPLMSDPGKELVRLAIDAGIRIEPIPGPSAITTALAVSGFATQPFTFLGFPPARSKDRRDWFAELSKLRSTVVFFESPHRIRATLLEIRSNVGDCRVVICRELTKVHEELVRGPISTASEAQFLETGELTVVIDLAHKPEMAARAAVSDSELSEELGRITDLMKISRRQGIQRLAKTHGRTPNDIYAAVERAKQSGK